jgi:hypothetical protein
MFQDDKNTPNNIQTFDRFVLKPDKYAFETVEDSSVLLILQFV